MLGVVLAGALIGMGVEGVGFLSDVDLPTFWCLLGGIVAFALLELRNRRASNRRIAVGSDLLVAVAAGCEPKRAGWFRGLPYLRGQVDGVAFAAHLEPEGEALRLAVAVEIEPEAEWIASVDRPGFPRAWMQDLVDNQGFSWVGERVVARDVEAAEAVLQTAEGRAALALTEVSDVAATVEIGRDSGRWDVALGGVDAATVLHVARTLGALEGERPPDSSVSGTAN